MKRLKELRHWASYTAFDAAMPLGFVILFEGGPLLLLILVIFLMWRAVNKVDRIKKDKEEQYEDEVNKAAEKNE